MAYPQNEELRVWLDGQGHGGFPLEGVELVTISDATEYIEGTRAKLRSVERTRRTMTDLLYKVSHPRDDWTFEPRRFWRAEDWSFSDDHPHDGLIEDRVLYVAQFDEVNIHLLPKVWRLRVWLDDEERCRRLERLGFSWKTGSRAVIFALESDKELIDSFSPTVYAFDRSGFARTPTDEFVSREPRKAVTAETMSFDDARQQWQFDLLYVNNSDELIQSLRLAGVDHQIQT